MLAAAALCLPPSLSANCYGNCTHLTVDHGYLVGAGGGGSGPVWVGTNWSSIARLLAERMPNVGAIGFALTVAAYLYYSLWVLLTPFVEKDVVWFHNLFPDTWWALAVPTALLVLGVTCVITFVGILGR